MPAQLGLLKTGQDGKRLSRICGDSTTFQGYGIAENRIDYTNSIPNAYRA